MGGERKTKEKKNVTPNDGTQTGTVGHRRKEKNTHKTQEKL